MYVVNTMCTAYEGWTENEYYMPDGKRKESYCRYNDILQGDYFEDYFLLAYKSLSWLDWTKKHCHKVRAELNFGTKFTV
jgi:hypothetical protein